MEEDDRGLRFSIENDYRLVSVFSGDRPLTEWLKDCGAALIYEAKLLHELTPPLQNPNDQIASYILYCDVEDYVFEMEVPIEIVTGVAEQEEGEAFMCNVFYGTISEIFKSVAEDTDIPGAHRNIAVRMIAEYEQLPIEPPEAHRRKAPRFIAE